MPAETNLQTMGSLSPDIPAVYLKDKMLERANKDLVFWPLTTKSKQPTGEGTTCQFVRYERLVLPAAPLEEGVTPAATPMKLSTVTATVDFWGAYVAFSDRVELTIKHPIMQTGKELLQLQYDETVDREVQVVTMGSSAVSYADNVAARSSLTASNTLDSTDVRREVSRLRAQGAPPWEGGLYKGVFDPYVEGDLNADGTFTNASSYSQIKTLKEFEVGVWMGVMWSRSNGIPIISQMSGASVTESALTGGSIPAGTSGFTASSSVRTKVTKLDDSTRFETSIDDEATVTNAAAFAVQVQINSAAATGIYMVYATLQDGVTGTATLQCRVNHTTGTNSVVVLVKSGTPAATNVFVADGTGRLAPPSAPATITIHSSYIFGRGGVGSTELQGLQTYVTPKGATKSDPLDQRRYMGWKSSFKALILNPDFFRRVESASAFN